ncbi:MAG TPA: DUF4199 domain-containing protein [Niabella sp.]|nr:DUF4199 domain-containing protein [Niabella sp.]HOZ96745.1 DUF4199 domain-containing protein [Niabella sp.]HQW14778.1 DUF4199 domain-containing protein [Niabella sp.]HQX19970.1 DUF4199 domain-containing protein [Niabella sp.]HQX42197.1 DUF4199 domain-containing protein [Niabella sp.]
MNKYSIEIKWAIYFIAMSLGWMLLEKWVGLHSTHIDKHMYLTNLFAIPAVVVMVMALKEKKKLFYDGKMSYKRGLICGLIISLMIALFSPLTQWIISYVITPEYFPNVIEHSLKTGYYKSRAEAEAFFSYNNYAVQSVVASIVMGMSTTAIAMIFLRTKPNSTS